MLSVEDLKVIHETIIDFLDSGEVEDSHREYYLKNLRDRITILLQQNIETEEFRSNSSKYSDELSRLVKLLEEHKKNIDN